MNDKKSNPENPTGPDERSLGADEQAPGADERSLGAALGAALHRRVEAPTVQPPADRIAERAAAYARTRTTRRAVMGVAASFALIAGGIVAWNAVDRDRATETVVAGDPSPTSGPEPTAAAAGEPPDGFQGLPQPAAGADTGPITPAGLSTGKALEWTEFDPVQAFGADIDGTLDVYDIASVGDGRVLVKTLGGPDGSRVLVSRNGTDWTKVSLPPDLDLERIDLTGDRWLATGWILDASDPLDDYRAFFSDDQGTTWTGVTLDTGGSGELLSGSVAMVSGKNMVIAVKVSPPGSDQVDAHVYHSNGGPAERVAEYQAQEITGYSTADGFYLTLRAADDIWAERLVTSPDGRQWEEASLDDGNWTIGITTLVHPVRQRGQTSSDDGNGVSMGRFFGYYETAGETIWMLDRPGDDHRFERFDGIYAPVLITELPDGVTGPDVVGVGPAGTAVVAGAKPSSAASTITELRGVKDGYELRYDLLEGRIVLRDLDAGVVVREFDTANIGLGTLPESIREIPADDGDTEGLVFEDPDTGEDLVTFVMDDLEPPDDDGNLPGATGGVFDQWVGWSDDGQDWGWQALSDAFGLSFTTDLEKRLTQVRLAVGENFVIARVKTYERTGSDDGSMGQSPRWFIARTG